MIAQAGLFLGGDGVWGTRVARRAAHVVSIRVELVRGVRVASAPRRMPENATAPVSTRTALHPRFVNVLVTGEARRLR